MTLFNPPHPFEVLRQDVLPEIKLTITALAKHLGFSRGLLSNVIHCRVPISADMAVRLERAELGQARIWLGRQSANAYVRLSSRTTFQRFFRVVQAA
jgi:addiction module HigA family antidote